MTLRSLFPLLLSFVGYISAQTASDCSALQSTLHLENTTIVSATHVPRGSNITTTPGSCIPSVVVKWSMCRVQFTIQTTPTSFVRAEAWLPDEWYGRFLGVGNGGLGGCIDYNMLDYGNSLHFASIGSDNGHDGKTNGTAFTMPEVLNDYGFRAIHVEAVIGKQIVQAYYKRAHTKSYFLGCSTGGRQGTQAALKYPDDFDGIVAGSPAVDYNRLLGWMIMLAGYVGIPTSTTGPSFIPLNLWNVIAAEIMRQCDGLDGVMDGIITEPDDCHFRPSVLRCNSHRKTDCLSAPQLAAVKKIYSPLIGTDGEVVYSRYDPGTSVVDKKAIFDSQTLFGGTFFYIPQIYYRYAIFNNPNYDFHDFNLSSIALADKINPGDGATFEGDMTAFKKRGGKLIAYHGRQDPIIASGHSKRYYNLVSETMGIRNLDSFYRLFLVPGMSHCLAGPGAVNFGHYGSATNVVNTTTHNVLLSLVDWVENGVAPDTIIGTGANGAQRSHCRYPHRSVWNGSTFQCR